MCPNWLSTISNDSSGYGKFSTSASSNGMSILARAAFSRARCNKAWERSEPVTCAPALAAVNATTPVPEPTSRTLCSDCTPANLTSAGAAVPVMDSNGENVAQSSRAAFFMFSIASR